jgi:hypothetical protein
MIISEDEIDGECSTHRRDEKCIKILSGNLRESDRLGELES